MHKILDITSVIIMATALIGSINPFESNTETWTSYQERLEQYFIVNDIAAEKRVAGLLTLLGERTYCLLRSLTSPAKPSEKTYKELCDLLSTHLSPKPLIIAERFRFHKRNQATGECIKDYVATLRKLAEFCNFGDNLNDTLRDRFVCGLREETTQRKLLSTVDLTFAKAIEIATAMETATKDAAELQSSAATGSVHRIANRKHTKTRPPPKRETVQVTSKPNCIHCGKNNHVSQKCRLKNAVCHFCKTKGHIQKICLKMKHVNAMNTTDNDNVLIINSVNRGDNKITVSPEIDGHIFRMEVDTGSAVTLMSEIDFRKRFGNVPLDPAKSVLKTYSGEIIKQVGTKVVTVKYNGQSTQLRLCVVQGTGPMLFGRDWLTAIKLDWQRIVPVNVIERDIVKDRLNTILKNNAIVFDEGIGKVKDIKARLTLKEDASPRFLKARTVPYSMKPKIERELDSLERQGIISKINTSRWATPIVPVLKSNGQDVRICGDFKVTVNQALKVDKYPLPRIEDIFANLSHGQKYSKLDLRQAYLQLEVDDDSKELLTINTHQGLYRYNRCVYGISSLPAIWQRTIDQILQGIPGVQCILDDMIVTGDSDQSHLDNLEKVLCRLNEFGLKLNKDKCVFFEDRVTYCGHEIDKDGLWKCNDKVQAVIDTPTPKDVTSLRAYLGVLNYYHRFLPNLATVIKPLNAMLEKNRKFIW